MSLKSDTTREALGVLPDLPRAQGTLMPPQGLCCVAACPPLVMSLLSLWKTRFLIARARCPLVLSSGRIILTRTSVIDVVPFYCLCLMSDRVVYQAWL